MTNLKFFIIITVIVNLFHSCLIKHDNAVFNIDGDWFYLEKQYIEYANDAQTVDSGYIDTLYAEISFKRGMMLIHNEMFGISNIMNFEINNDTLCFYDTLQNGLEPYFCAQVKKENDSTIRITSDVVDYYCHKIDNSTNTLSEYIKEIKTTNVVLTNDYFNSFEKRKRQAYKFAIKKLTNQKVL